MVRSAPYSPSEAMAKTLESNCCSYRANGFDNREAYLDSLREEYGGLVDIMTGILPDSEDFDGLVTSLEDATDSGEYDDLI
jgi:hypothetical protein